jgi:hypothetical protein
MEAYLHSPVLLDGVVIGKAQGQLCICAGSMWSKMKSIRKNVDGDRQCQSSFECDKLRLDCVQGMHSVQMIHAGGKYPTTRSTTNRRWLLNW